jgi:hypothetical protein
LYVTVTLRHVFAVFDGQGSSQADAVIALLVGDGHVVTLPLFGATQVLSIQPTSAQACASATVGALDVEVMMPARAASAAAWVTVAWAAKIRPKVMMP